MKRREVKEIITTLSDVFYDLEQACNTLPIHLKRKIFSPEGIGEVSSFLGLGNGYEPFNPHHFKAEDILECFPIGIEEDEEDDLEEDEENVDEEEVD